MKKTIAAIITASAITATPAIAGQFGECALANYEQHLGVEATPEVRFAALMQFQVMRKVIAEVASRMDATAEGAIMMIAEQAAKDGDLTDDVSVVFISVLPCAHHIKVGIQS